MKNGLLSLVPINGVHPMILALDVCYDESEACALSACVGFHSFQDDNPAFTQTVLVQGVQPYVPGLFWQRELPPLLEVIRCVSCPIDLIIIDGYVKLHDRPGLGFHLWEALGGTIPIIGVAKTRFRDAHSTEILRGTSKNPLFVTSIGINEVGAAKNIREMHGPHRIPTLLKEADRLSRNKQP